MSCTCGVGQSCTYKVPIFQAFNCYAKAIEDCRFCLITKQHFQQLMLKKPEMSLKVLEVLSQRLIHLEQLTLMLSNQDPESKLAYLLLELAKKEGVQVGSKMVIRLPFTREEVANYTGLTRETVSRKLHQLSEKGIINIIGHKKIEILDVAYLKDLL